LNAINLGINMNLSDVEKEAIEKYTTGTELIKDLDEARNILAIHGEKCEKAIDSSIREQAVDDYRISKI
jgi:hypothetical protein